jgi:hypothetical protein
MGKKAKARAAKAQAKAAAAPPLTRDSYVDLAANLGVTAPNLSNWSTYEFNPITRERMLLDWMYRGSWVVVGADQVGFAQVGAVQFGAGQVSAGHFGVEQVGAGQVVSSDIRIGQIRTKKFKGATHRPETKHRSPSKNCDAHAQQRPRSPGDPAKWQHCMTCDDACRNAEKTRSPGGENGRLPSKSEGYRWQ